MCGQADQRVELPHVHPGARLLPGLARGAGDHALAVLEKAGGQRPQAPPRLDRPQAQQHAIPVHRQAADDDLRVLVMDLAAVRADEARQRVALGDPELERRGAAGAAELHASIIRAGHRARPTAVTAARANLRRRGGSYRRLRKRRGHSVAVEVEQVGAVGPGARRSRLPPSSASERRGCVVLESKERELVFRPVREYVRTPADLGYRYDDLWIDGRRRRTAARASASTPGGCRPAAPDAPAILYLHGIRWSLGNNLFRIARWRGARLLGPRDRLSGLRPQRRRAAQRGADLCRRARSMGRAQAPRARRRPPVHLRPLARAPRWPSTSPRRSDGAAGVIAEAGFTSLADVVAESSTALSLLVTQKLRRAVQGESAQGPRAVPARHAGQAGAARDERKALRGHALAQASATGSRGPATATGTAPGSTTTAAWSSSSSPAPARSRPPLVACPVDALGPVDPMGLCASGPGRVRRRSRGTFARVDPADATRIDLTRA